MTPAKKGNILFHGIKIENEKLKYPLNKITFHGNDIQIQPIVKRS
jgi:predicted Zn-dependent protease